MTQSPWGQHLFLRALTRTRKATLPLYSSIVRIVLSQYRVSNKGQSTESIRCVYMSYLSALLGNTTGWFTFFLRILFFSMALVSKFKRSPHFLKKSRYETTAATTPRGFTTGQTCKVMYVLHTGLYYLIYIRNIYTNYLVTQSRQKKVNIST